MMKTKFLTFLFCAILVSGLASCSSEDADENVALPLSVSIANGEKQDLILGNSLTLEAKIENGSNAKYEWSLNNKEVSNELTYTFSPSKTGTYEVKFTAFKDNEKVTTTVVVNVFVTYDPVKKISDIHFWTGEGENQSALAIQWISGDEWESPIQDNVHLLSWGYRWNASDNPTGHQMILAIAKADPRLFVFVGPGFGGIDSQSIRGFGYDANGDGRFTIKNTETSVTYDAADFVDGVITLSGNDSGDGYASTDPADYWIGGWYQGYCSYYLGSNGINVPEMFDYSQVMAGLRKLSQNSWDAWTFSSINGDMINTLPFSEWMVSAVANHK